MHSTHIGDNLIPLCLYDMFVFANSISGIGPGQIFKLGPFIQLGIWSFSNMTFAI